MSGGSASVGLTPVADRSPFGGSPARLVGLGAGMGVLALVRAHFALSGAIDAVLLGLLYGLAWLGLAALGAGRRERPTRSVLGVELGAASRARLDAILGAASGARLDAILRAASGARLGAILGAVLLGCLGGLVLVGVSIADQGPAPLLTAHAAPFGAWAAVTTLVAVAEELVLRGVFFDAARDLVGPLGAAVLAALAFALIHVPIDGWSIVPLDVGVGLWLAGLRLASGRVAAPAAAHVVADLATWWL